MPFDLITNQQIINFKLSSNYHYRSFPVNKVFINKNGFLTEITSINNFHSWMGFICIRRKYKKNCYLTKVFSFTWYNRIQSSITSSLWEKKLTKIVKLKGNKLYHLWLCPCTSNAIEKTKIPSSWRYLKNNFINIIAINQNIYKFWNIPCTKWINLYKVCIYKTKNHLTVIMDYRKWKTMTPCQSDLLKKTNIVWTFYLSIQEEMYNNK